MVKNTPLLLLVGLVITTIQICKAGVYYDPVKEAVIIDDTTTFDPAEFDPARPPTDDATTLRPEGYCITAGGGSGSCIPLSECYPYAEFMMQEDPDSYIAKIVNSTEPCSADDQSYVCCPNYSYKTLPIKKPGVLQPFPTTAVPPTSTVSTTTTVETTVAPIKNVTKATCGTFTKELTTDDNVVGGRFATRGEFPWAVAITNNGAQFCGGSLFKSQWILTAAHCVQQLTSAAGLRVLIGAHNLGAAETGRESRGVTKILYHRSFAMHHLQNDVALLQLSAPVASSTYIQPICLNSAEMTYPGRVDLAGWGKTGNHAPPSRILKTVNMALIPPSSCKQQYQGTNAPPISNGMICAGETSPALKDACNGDSGGPLSQKDAGGTSAKQVGIVSWGIGCGQKPGVFTKVSAYLPWINKNSV